MTDAKRSQEKHEEKLAKTLGDASKDESNMSVACESEESLPKASAAISDDEIQSQAKKFARETCTNNPSMGFDVGSLATGYRNGYRAAANSTNELDLTAERSSPEQMKSEEKYSDAHSSSTIRQAFAHLGMLDPLKDCGKEKQFAAIERPTESKFHTFNSKKDMNLNEISGSLLSLCQRVFDVRDPSGNLDPLFIKQVKKLLIRFQPTERLADPYPDQSGTSSDKAKSDTDVDLEKLKYDLAYKHACHEDDYITGFDKSTEIHRAEIERLKAAIETQTHNLNVMNEEWETFRRVIEVQRQTLVRIGTETEENSNFSSAELECDFYIKVASEALEEAGALLKGGKAHE